MHGDRESRERGDGHVVESVAQSVSQRGETGSGTLGQQPHGEGQGERDHDDGQHGGPRQPTHGREAEREGDDLRRGENVDGEDEPDR